MHKLIAILGPTGSGKSGLAIKLARQFGGEIVNADSRQVYRGMDIGTAKPSWDKPDEIATLPMVAREDKNNSTVFASPEGTKQSRSFFSQEVSHYCFDLVDPDQPFTLADWKLCALRAIRDIHARGRIPLLVGGTGLYIQAIVDNLDIPAVPPEARLRENLQAKSKIELLRELEAKDPGTAQTIDHHNKRRMIRALEVIEATGKKFSELRRKGEPLFDFLQIGIDPYAFEIATLPPVARDGNKKAPIASACPNDSSVGRGAKQSLQGLFTRIDARVDQMIAAGLLDEVRGLLATYDPKLPALQSIGYRELAPALSWRGREAAEAISAATQRIKFATHALARRQMTWFRRDPRIKWIKKDEEATLMVSDFLSAVL